MVKQLIFASMAGLFGAAGLLGATGRFGGQLSGVVEAAGHLQVAAVRPAVPVWPAGRWSGGWGFRRAEPPHPRFHRDKPGGGENPLRTPASLGSSEAVVSQAPLETGLATRGGPAVGLVLTTGAEGVYQVTATQLAEALWLSEAEARAAILAGQFALTRQELPVAYLPAVDGAFLRFFAVALKTPYTKANVYHLRPGPGLLATTVELPGPAAEFVDELLVFRLFEEDMVPTLDLRLRTDQDVWSWTKLQAGDPIFGTSTFSVRTVGRRAGLALLSLRLRGGVDALPELDHLVELLINGTVVGKVSWGGFAEAVLEAEFDALLLVDGRNTIGVRSLPVAGVAGGVCTVESFDLFYPGQATASGNWLDGQLAGAGTYAYAGFSTGAIELLDATQPDRPIRLAGGVAEPAAGKWRLRFALPTDGRRVVGFTATAVKTPVVRPLAAATLEDAGNATDYLVVAPASLLAAAELLADYRRGTGLDVLVASFEAVCDAFAAGVRDPLAIRRLLVHARAHWAKPPRFVVLVGDGTYDYYGYHAYGDNLLPPPLIATEFGVFANDAPLADLDDDGWPDLPLGRIPVENAAQMAAYLVKLANWENNDPSAWPLTALLAADASTTGVERFAVNAAALGQWLPTAATTHLLEVDVANPEATRVELLRLLNAGARLFNYVGHGSLSQLSPYGLLRSVDIGGLANAELPTVLIAASCLVGQFSVPGHDSLAENLLLAANGGAVAVIAAVAPTYNSANLFFNRQLLLAFDDSAHVTLGEAFLTAARAERNGSYASDVYTLLGDPAMGCRLFTLAPADPTEPTDPADPADPAEPAEPGDGPKWPVRLGPEVGLPGCGDGSGTGPQAEEVREALLRFLELVRGLPLTGSRNAAEAAE